MSSQVFATRVFASSLLVILVVFLPYLRVSVPELFLEKIRDGLVYQETRYPVNNKRRVAVGFGSCWDLVTNGVSLLDKANITPPSIPRHFDTISSSEELGQVFAYFFQNGAAAERFVSNKDFFDFMVSTAKDINSTHWSLGGNAPVMSQRLAMEGWEVLLAAKTTPATVQNLHDSIQLSIKPSNSAREDIHLIMEYDISESWGKYRTSRGNRFVIHNDYSNMMLESLDGFHQAIIKFNPHLVIVSGLQLLDNYRYDCEIRTQRLKSIRDILTSLPKSVKVHFEMASFSEELLLKELMEYVIPYADSLGMNEQELGNLYSLLVHGEVNFVSDSNPRIATALDQGRAIYHLINQNKSSDQHQLTRIHIHTLAYQAIFTMEGSGWIHTRSASAKASLMATRHVCGSHHINITNSKLLMDESFSVSTQPGSKRIPLIEDVPVSCWHEENIKICIAPNLVCTAIYKTVAAGDNISAAGLSIQL